MNKYIYSLLTFLLLFTSNARGYNIDSLMTAINTLPLEQQHIKVKGEMNGLKETNPKEAINLGNFWISKLSDQQALDMAADMLVMTGDLYYVIGNYSKRLEYSQTANKYYKKTGNKKGEAITIRDMGFCYKKMGQNQDAYNAIEKSILMFQELKNYNELAAAYNFMGNLVEDWKNELTHALALYRQSITYAQKENNKESISYSYEFIGIIKSKQGDDDSAIYYFNKSLALREELQLSFPLALSYTNLGEVMDKKGDFDKAQKYYNQALEISSVIQHNDLTNFLYENLSKVHKKQGNLSEAINYLELQKQLQDSLFNLQKTKEFAAIKEQYESEVKEEKIRTLNKQIELDQQKDQKRIFIYSTAISVLSALVLIAVLIIIVAYNRTQKQIAQKNIAQEKIRNKMIIEAEEKERTRIAKDLHDSLGQMLAALKMNLNSLSEKQSQKEPFNKTLEILDDTITEMRSISHAMMPESLVKNGLDQALIDISQHVPSDKTKVNVNVDNWKGWDRTGEYVLYRVVQELLNNTLKHADAKNVSIELNQFDDEINLIYEDDGKGFDLKNMGPATGIGLQNLNNRIASINGQIEFDTKPGSGTTAIISIPI